MSQVFHQIGWFALLTTIIGLLPLGVALLYAIAPSERRLAVMRPLSLAAIFGALSGVFSGFIAVLRGIGVTTDLTADSWRRISVRCRRAPVCCG